MSPTVPEGTPSTSQTTPLLLSDFVRGRIQGIRDSADLLRAAAGKERLMQIFIPGQQPKTVRAMNRGLMNAVSGILDQMAGDMASGTIKMETPDGPAEKPHG